MNQSPQEPSTSPALRGFIVHAWTKSGQIRVAGRLENRRSFALLQEPAPAAILVAGRDAEAARKLLASRLPAGPPVTGPGQLPHESFEGIPLTALPLAGRQWESAAELLASAGLRVFGEAPRPAEDFLSSHGIRGLLEITGESIPGKRVDCVFQHPGLQAGDGPLIPLNWLAIDIETAREGSLRAISLVWRGPDTKPNPENFAVAEVLFRGPVTGMPEVRSYATEAGMLTAFIERLVAIDPDVITGWNVIDFDLEWLCQRAAFHQIPFLIGRSDEPARVEKRPGLRTRCFIPGRQAVDAMQLFRGSGTRFEDQTLDTVAAGLLGLGKTVHLRGEAKLAELDRLFAQEPAAFCQYCLEDSRLVIRILEKTGLDQLTQNRAALTGVGIDLAWTSIPSFERIYALELARRGILPPDKDSKRAVSGASGGMVLNPKAGLFQNVLVLDFRSLYPSIMRTFGIDPLGHERCRIDPHPDDIIAPNSARFRREAGILPALITSYFQERLRAQANGDENGSQTYKILMNSFYGVLGSPGCRYGRTELAGAITSFGRFWLEFSRDFFEAAGFRVLYGDTDSVFVGTGLADADTSDQALISLGGRLAEELNQRIALEIQSRYQLESHLAIRSEKLYRRFLIPRMRSKSASGADAERGRAKGYAGLLVGDDGNCSVDVKGMEAARSDWTPLARRFQMELLAMVFADSPAAEIKTYLEGVASELRAGKLDKELVYRKQLRRNASAYEHSETPQVRAARLLGWTNRRGSIEYLMTTAGAEPVELISHGIDYEHYVDHQLLPIWDSIADAANLAGSSGFSRQSEFEF